MRNAAEYSFNAYDADSYGVGVRTFDVYERQYEQQLQYEEERKAWEHRGRFRR